MINSRKNMQMRHRQKQNKERKQKEVQEQNEERKQKEAQKQNNENWAAVQRGDETITARKKKEALDRMTSDYETTQKQLNTKILQDRLKIRDKIVQERNAYLTTKVQQTHIAQKYLKSKQNIPDEVLQTQRKRISQNSEFKLNLDKLYPIPVMSKEVYEATWRRQRYNDNQKDKMEKKLHIVFEELSRELNILLSVLHNITNLDTSIYNKKFEEIIEKYKNSQATYYTDDDIKNACNDLQDFLLKLFKFRDDSLNTINDRTTINYINTVSSSLETILKQDLQCDQPAKGKKSVKKLQASQQPQQPQQPQVEPQVEPQAPQVPQEPQEPQELQAQLLQLPVNNNTTNIKSIKETLQGYINYINELKLLYELIPSRSKNINLITFNTALDTISKNLTKIVVEKNIEKNIEKTNKLFETVLKNLQDIYKYIGSYYEKHQNKNDPVAQYIKGIYHLANYIDIGNKIIAIQKKIKGIK